MKEMDCSTYCVIDVETPNHRNDRISSIGLVLIADGRIVETRSYLVNPEVEFDEFNSLLTGLTTETVQDSPTLPEVWAEVSDMVTNSIVVAHNAPFDLTVLRKAFAAYGIVCPPLDYFDTVRLARKALPDLTDHRLDTLCQYYNITLDHHQADSDSLACAQVFMRLHSDAGQPSCWDWTVKPRHTAHSPRCKSVRHEGQPIVIEGISLNGKRVCLTGEFAVGKRADVSAALEQMGAITCPRVTKKLDYLIVGEMGSHAWSGGSSGGTKIRQVLEMQARGVLVKIIREREIFALSEAEMEKTDEIDLFDSAPLTPMQRIAADFRAALEGTKLGYDTSMIQVEMVSPQKSDPYERGILDVAGRKQPLFRPATKKGYVQCPPFVAAELAKMGIILEPVPSSRLASLAPDTVACV